MSYPSRAHQFVARRRRELGWSQSKFGEAYGVHQVTISRIEAGEDVARDIIGTLRETLGVPADWWFLPAAEEPAESGIGADEAPAEAS